jgi:uncharacterized protein involved in cysteine biosynthesis
MEQRPNEECEDCFWWYEDASLCLECRDNPKAHGREPSEKKKAFTHGEKIRDFAMATILLTTIAIPFMNLFPE